MELDDAVHTAILTLKEGYIYITFFYKCIICRSQKWEET